MADGRWYPSCVALPFNRVFAISGHGGAGSGYHENTRFEIYDASADFWTPPRETFPPIEDHGIAQIYYPRLHLLPDGNLFCSSAWQTSKDGKRTRLLDPNTGTVVALSKIPEGRHCDHVYKGANFSSALLPLEPPFYNARILICGGQYPRLFDMQTPGKGWAVAGGEVAGKRPYGKRAYATAVLLPDGSVLVVNGCRSERGYPLSGGGHDSEAVLFAERYVPDAPYWPPHQRDTWEQLSSSTIPRVYHSVALLLPDGRVWIAGSNHDSGRNRGGNSIDQPGTDARELRMELYSPPYMDSATRPQMGSAPATMDYGKKFTIGTPDAQGVSRVVLIRAGSVTHAFDFDQRYVQLEITSRTGTSVDVKGPPHVNVAPEGVYLVFLVDANNVPSVGRFVRLINPQAPQPAVASSIFTISEHQKGDLDTKIDVKVGDRLSITAEGEIYAGVWFTGNNGPGGWDDVTTDPKFPYTGRPDAHVYSLIAKVGSGPYFYVGTRLDRRPMTTAGRLFLRINDDLPRNGSGSFRGSITVNR